MRRIKYWPLALLVICTLVFAFGWGGPEVRFPLALGVIRGIIFITENFWRRAQAQPSA